MKGRYDYMILLAILLLMLIILVATVVAVAATAGAGFVLLFGDVIVCAVFIVLIIRFLIRRKRR